MYSIQVKGPGAELEFNRVRECDLHALVDGRWVEIRLGPEQHGLPGIKEMVGIMRPERGKEG